MSEPAQARPASVVAPGTAPSPAVDQASAEAPAVDLLADPPADLADRLRLLESVEAELREQLGRLDPR